MIIKDQYKHMEYNKYHTITISLDLRLGSNLWAIWDGFWDGKVQHINYATGEQPNFWIIITTINYDRYVAMVTINANNYWDKHKFSRNYASDYLWE